MSQASVAHDNGQRMHVVAAWEKHTQSQGLNLTVHGAAAVPA